MPFVEKYKVDFSNGNLNPSLNPLGWPAMVHNPLPNDDYDHDGLILHVTRTSGPSVANDVYVPLAAGMLYVNDRFVMRVEFDLPWAEPLPGNPATPEPWAVGVSLSLNNNLAGTLVGVTCQFNAVSGVKINTGAGLQGDTSLPLVPPPLDYNDFTHLQLNGPPHHSAGHAKKLFTFEHSFCGFFDTAKNPSVTPHSVGGGKLTIAKNPPHTESDHRLYSTTVIAVPLPPNPVPSILAVGTSLVMAKNNTNPLVGVGNCQIRLRTFSVLMSE